MEAAPALTAVLVDSDVVTEVLRHRNPELAARWRAVGYGGAEIYSSPVTYAEIWRGIREGEQDQVESLFAEMTCLPIDAKVGRKAGEYLRRYQASHGLQFGDALIAATAAVHQVPLWTRNRKHYPMKDVRLV